MTFNPGIPIDPCRVEPSPDWCHRSAAQAHDQLLSMDHSALYDSVLGHSSTAYSAAGALLTGAVFTYAYRRSLGQLVASPFLSRFATKGVYDQPSAATNKMASE